MNKRPLSAVPAGFIVLFLMLSGASPALSLSDNNDEAQKKGLGSEFIAATFKVMAKAAVYVADMDKLKESARKRVSGMDEAGFSIFYLDFTEHLRGCDRIISDFGLKPGLTKKEALEKIGGLDKDKLYKMIDALPQETITRELYRYSHKSDTGIENKNRMISAISNLIASVKDKYAGSR